MLNQICDSGCWEHFKRKQKTPVTQGYRGFQQ